MVQAVRIPEERIGFLIGSNGSTLDEIEELTGADITVTDNEITVEHEDALDEMVAVNIVKAVGRGFGKDEALRLLEDNATLVVIDVNDFAGTDNSKERLKGRVIGRDGESKRHIESETNTEIAVYGKTISIIGPMGGIEAAKKAVEQLLSGRSHATAYRTIEQHMMDI